MGLAGLRHPRADVRYAARMTKKRKKRKGARERDWGTKHETAFSRDLVRHLRAIPSVTDAAPKAPLPDAFTPNATVISHTKKWAFVERDGKEALCRIDERLSAARGSLLAAGDRVLVEDEGDTAFVRAIAERHTWLSRPAKRGGREQVLAANVDLLLVIAAAADPTFKPGLVDRFLIAASVGGVTPILVLNKMDLVAAPPETAALYPALGVEMHCVSAETGHGLDALRARLAQQTSVLAGHSGVGKSTLVNALDPRLRVLTADVSAYSGRGRHTTTGARMYALQAGIRIIDTPGIRALGLWDVSPAEVARYYPDLAEHAARCRFRDCTHTHEPGCAVLGAVEAGDIAQARYASYLRVRGSLEDARGNTPGQTSQRRWDGAPPD